MSLSPETCAHHVEYASEQLALNAQWLHAVRAPECPVLNVIECGDHWHIGHPDRESRLACRAANPFRPVFAPRRRKRGRLYPSRRQAAS